MDTKRGILYLVGNDLPPTLKPHDVKCSATADRLWATKIGMTHSPAPASVDKKVASMNTGNSFGIVIKASMSCTSADKWEKYFHKLYDSKKVKNRWFALNSTDLKFIQDTIKIHEETGQGPDCALFEELMLEETLARKLEASVSVNKKTTPNIPPVIDKSLVLQIRKKHEQLAKKSRRASFLDDYETTILRKVIVNHPRASEKTGVGIRRFFVAKAKGLHSYCFHVERVDGSEEDFSYHYCFENPPKRKGYTHVRGPSRRY